GSTPLQNVGFVRVEDTASLAWSARGHLRKSLCSQEPPNGLATQLQAASDFADAYSLPRERSDVFITSIALRPSCLLLQFGVTDCCRSLIGSSRNRAIVFLYCWLCSWFCDRLDCWRSVDPLCFCRNRIGSCFFHFG